jgi:hypothetical protein
MANTNSKVTVSSSQGIENYDLVVISCPDSGWQEIFMCTDISSSLLISHDYYADVFATWNSDNNLDHRYPSGSIVTIVSLFNFFIREDDKGHSNLMVRTQGPYPAQILAGDIDNFQLRFKLKNDTWVVRPDNVEDIRLMELTLRAMTPNPLPDYKDPVYGDSHKRIELKTVVIPKNITKVSF